MALQRVTLQLRELRCLAQEESGGSEPYLWTTYFAFGAEPLPFQSGPLGVITPTYDAYRTEMPNNMKAGQATTIPVFIASASFDMDLDTAPRPKLIGCMAVLMEEDDTPNSSFILGSMAYSKEIDKQLNKFATKRLQAGNFGPPTRAELNAIKAAVKAKFEDAIESDQSFLSLIFGGRDDDNNLGFFFKIFTDTEITFQLFDFPEVKSGSNRFTLSGRLLLGPIPTPPVDLCATRRAAVKAKNDQIHSLQVRISLLQDQLDHGGGAGTAHEIGETAAALAQAEAELPALQAALDECQSHHFPGGVTTGTTTGADRNPP